MAPLPKMPSSATTLKHVRNRGPYPCIQSEGGFIEIPGTRAWNKKREPPPPSDNDPRRPVTLASVQCGDVQLNELELEAMIRYRQQLDLQKPVQRLEASRAPIGPKGKPTSKEDTAEEAEKWLPPKADPFASPQWADGLTPWDRLAMHHTLNSVRSNARMHRPLVFQADLEFLLNSIFDQSTDMWARKNEVVLQPETCDFPTWRVLKNTRVQVAEAPTIDSFVEPQPQRTTDEERRLLTGRQHPLRYGGLGSKQSPHSVKLAISGNHVSQTNAGYSRKVGGSFYS